MKKDKLSKEAQHLDNKITELGETTTRKLKSKFPLWMMGLPHMMLT